MVNSLLFKTSSAKKETYKKPTKILQYHNELVNVWNFKQYQSFYRVLLVLVCEEIVDVNHPHLIQVNQDDLTCGYVGVVRSRDRFNSHEISLGSLCGRRIIILNIRDYYAINCS